MLKKLWRMLFPKRNIIRYQDVVDEVISLQELKATLKTLIPKTALFAPTAHEITHAALVLFDLPLAPGKTGIEANAAKILDIYQSVNGLSPDAIIESFNKLYLDVEGLPLTEKQKLESQARQDLTKLEQLINYYENESPIKKLIAEKETPRNQGEYGRHAFYQRTLAKKLLVSNYIATDMENLALKKCEPAHREYQRSVGSMPDYVEKYQDFPYMDFMVNAYKPDVGLDLEKLDFERINPLRNKIFAHQFKSDYSQGYTPAINQELLDDVQPEPMLDSILAKVNRIPMICGRIAIFRELKDLFMTGKWYGFYALSMPQVEGIFAEMAKLANPKAKVTGSLPDKVKLVRPFSESSQFDFDYYEFYLPESRNKFSHTGKDSDIQVKCYYLLLDLASILTTCEDLNAELIQLSNMVHGGLDSLSHIGDISKLLQLTQQARTKEEFKDLSDRLEDLVYHQIAARIDWPAYLSTLDKDFKSALQQFSNLLQIGFYHLGLPEKDFAAMKPAEIDTESKDINAAIADVHYFLGEELKLLLEIENVINRLPNLFPKIPAALKEQFTQFKSDNMPGWQNIVILGKKLSFELPEDYMIKKKEQVVNFNAVIKPRLSPSSI